MGEVRGLGKPDVIPADGRTAGAVQRKILSADLLGKNRAVFVVWRQDHA